ncbi:unnamed protein product [Caenorhabditis bovis]|uniref:Uncharacterized protein n=1 Tax=Caenorhabditis bovis TaxID=2654633 RepID=A0A8S1ELZ2_9PELO|nr:unnamed protein product [Caenorhabditis bovis]
MNLSISDSSPVFWRHPLATTTTNFDEAPKMPGNADQEMPTADDVFEKAASARSDPSMHRYVNKPEGEMDMMIGFFLMNGFCIFFFLLFGLCVIFSCLRQCPTWCRRKPSLDIERTPLHVDNDDGGESTALKPKFKSIVSQVIKTNKVQTSVASENENSHQVNVHQFRRSPDRKMSVSSMPKSRKNSTECSRRNSRIDVQSSSQETSAMIRHNLLGPLSFDDLYYM